jgi:HPt (histidine-containing phosphotransfer) domain-containing protein
MRPILDGTALGRLYRFGGERLVHGMIDLFSQHGPQRLDVALSAFANDDLYEVQRTAHSLKSTAANFGATWLSDIARQIEYASEAKNRTSVAALLPELEVALQQSLVALLAERAQPSALRSAA